MSQKRIAIISDLHVGTGARALELCPHTPSRDDLVAKDQAFLQAFASLCESEAFKASGPIDALCVTGDISHEAHPLEFRRANEVLAFLMAQLGLQEHQVYAVPGNHDVNWAQAAEGRGRRYDAIQQNSATLVRRFGAASIGSLFQDPYFLGWDSDELLVVGLNTAAHDGPEPREGYHHGLVKQSTLDALDDYCRSLNRDDAQTRICLLHHHPLSYTDPRPDIADPSALVNAENLRELLSRHRFDLIVHGHKHWPRLSTFMEGNQWPLNILGAGSFSASPDPQWTGEIGNQFHVVQLSGRDGVDGHSPGLAFGYVQTWVYQISGRWVASSNRIGLRATCGFGSVITPPVVEALCRRALSAAEVRGGICDWDLLTSEAPTLKHVSPSQLHSTLSVLGPNLGFKFCGDVDSEQLHWVLYQERP